MPGVADVVRRTGLKTEARARKQDMEELIRMVKEDRLHEADERQMEALKLSLELNSLLSAKPQAEPASGVSAQDISEVVQQAVAAALAQVGHVTTRSGTGMAEAPGRPSMKHTSLADLHQADSGLEISGDLGETSQSSDDASSKLEKLKKLKGNG
jgi:hypothetical protein